MARHADTTYSIGIYQRGGVPLRWRVIVPRFKDGQPVGCKRRMYYFDLRIPKKQIETIAKKLYMDSLNEIDAQSCEDEKLLTACLEYHSKVTCGPAPKAAGTQALEWRVIRDVACWLADRYEGREDQPTPPTDLFGPGQDAHWRGVQNVAKLMDVPLDQVNLALMADYRDYLARRLGPVSVNLHLRHLRAMLRWLTKHERLKNLDIASLQLDQTRRTQGGQPKTQKRIYSREELRQIIHHLDQVAPETGVFCRLAYLTGARASEVQRLKKSGIDLQRGLLQIPGVKTTPHAVALFPALTRLLDAWAGTWTVRQDAHYRAVQGAVRQLGIEIAQPLHGIRHTLVTDLRAAGVPTEDVARWVGHSLPGATWGVITGTYDHAHVQTLKRVANMIEVPW